MRRRILHTAIAITASAVLLAGCASDNNGGGGGGGGGGDTPKIGVILPDTASSVRWETADRRFLAEAFEAAGVDYEIQNAQGDTNQFQTIADQLIASDIDVLMIVNLDSGSGTAVLEKARAQGIATIDYDRLTLGGGADYYVSFDNVAVGRLQGEGLIKCLDDAGTTSANIIVLNGSPTDNNATLFNEGGIGALQPKVDAGDYTIVGEEWVPDWDNQQAGTIFEQLYAQANGDVDGVLAANDGLGNATIAILEKNGLDGQVPVTGQDATDQGLQNVLAGTQCMTVYKAIKQEADGAAELAVALANGERPDTGATVTDTETGEEVAAKLLVPIAVYKENVKDVIDDGFTTVENVCTGDFAQYCEEVGIS